MSTFSIKTSRSGQDISKPHFYILNQGMNSGKPLSMPCPNCFLFTAETEEEKEFYYWLTFGLWNSKAFHPFLRGSVIPFIVINELKKCIEKGAEEARADLEKFQEAIKALKFLELKEKQFKQNLQLISDARRAVFYRYERKW